MTDIDDAIERAGVEFTVEEALRRADIPIPSMAPMGVQVPAWDRRLLAAEVKRLRVQQDAERIRAAISDAYYDARNDGLTMEHAADVATAAVLGIVR